MRRLIPLIATMLIVPFVPVLGAEPEKDEGVPIELVGEAPSWWTPEAMAATKEAAKDGNMYNPAKGKPVPAGDPPPAGGIPAGAPDYLLIRPGALFLGESGFLCTYNFVYSTYAQIGTAGHCVESVGETAFILAVPTIPLVTAVGTVSSFRDGGVGNDWALINIDPQWNGFVDANTAYIGGPGCSQWTPALESAKHVGHGIQTGLVASVPRASVITASDGTSFSAAGEISGGDSGSPIIETVGALPGCAGGGAIGVITHCLSITGIECLPLFLGTDIREVPATVTPGFDPA